MFYYPILRQLNYCKNQLSFNLEVHTRSLLSPYLFLGYNSCTYVSYLCILSVYMLIVSTYKCIHVCVYLVCMCKVWMYCIIYVHDMYMHSVVWEKNFIKIFSL